MTEEKIASLLDELGVGIDEIAGNCGVDQTWIAEHVQAGVLLGGQGTDPARWGFDANPELAGLFVDLQEELERLRTRLRRAGISLD
jgi:chaperone modulatory protein CbpM